MVRLILLEDRVDVETDGQADQAILGLVSGDAKVAGFHHYVIGANWSVDDQQSWFGYGFSTIISPEGKVLATARSLHGSEIVYAEIETAGR